MTRSAIMGLAFIALFIAFLIFRASREDPMQDPAFAARVNQALLEDCLKVDRERIRIYGEARPTEDCKARELAYAMKQK